MAAKKVFRYVWNGDGLVRLREKAGLSQRALQNELYARYGKSIIDRTIGNWEQERTRPDADQLGMLAVYFKVPPTRFYATFYRRERV